MLLKYACNIQYQHKGFLNVTQLFVWFTTGFVIKCGLLLMILLKYIWLLNTIICHKIKLGFMQTLNVVLYHLFKIKSHLRVLISEHWWPTLVMQPGQNKLTFSGSRLSHSIWVRLCSGALQSHILTQGSGRTLGLSVLGRHGLD